MTAGGHLIVEVRDRVLRVLINRAEKRNALSRALLAAIRDTFATHASDQTLIAAVITGAGDRCFAAGGDLRDLHELRAEADGERMARDARGALDAIRSFPVPVIAALNGDALGGGSELAASCDFRIATPTARIGFIQGRLAISTAWGGGIDLHRIVGRQKAMRLLTTARILTAAEAHDIGLFDAVAPDGQDLLDAVDGFIEPMRSIPPQVHRAFKALSLATFDRRSAEATELSNFALCWGHQDHWTAHDKIMSQQAAR